MGTGLVHLLIVANVICGRFVVYNFVTFGSFNLQNLTDSLIPFLFLLLVYSPLVLRLYSGDARILKLGGVNIGGVVILLHKLNKLLNHVHIRDLRNAALMLLKLQVHQRVVLYCMVVYSAEFLHVFIVRLALFC